MGHINYAPLLFAKQMLRRNFLKKILISTIGIIAMSNKLFAKEMFSKPIFKDGIFYNIDITNDVGDVLLEKTVPVSDNIHEIVFKMLTK